jgi:hypothetical protein
MCSRFVLSYPKEKVICMTWFEIVGLVSAIALLLPIITILILRLAWYKSFPALLIYYILVAGHTFLTLGLIKTDKTFIYYWGVTNNFLDAPLMLAFMTYFSKTAMFRKKMKLFIPVFIFFELIVIAVFGYNIDAAIIVMAPGLSLVLIFSVLFFIHQARITVVYQKAAGKALITTALLFAYGGYAFVYVVYYLVRTPYKADTFVIYFLVTIISSFLLTTGIFFERKRVKQLTELKITREELKLLYGH